MIITVDGSAKSGKSSAAERLAAALGIRLLNTGAMYRAAGLALADATLDPTHAPDFIAAFHFDMPDCRVVLNGIDYTDRSETDEAGEAASRVGTVKAVRDKLKAEQRRLVAEWGSAVCDGRDQGTAVFPHAEVKFFVVADIAVRAERRRVQLERQGKVAAVADIIADLRQRDHRDETRDIDPLRPAPDAHRIDTSNATLDEILALMLQKVDECTRCR